jgi:hypothetical protein
MRAKPHFYSEDFARTFCRLIAGGASRQSVHRLPDMPSSPSVTRWRRMHPEFNRMYLEACEARAERAARLGVRDPADGGSDGDYTEARGEAICALVAEGWSLRDIARRADAPCLRTVYVWKAAHEAFRAAYLAAWEQHAQLTLEDCVEIADEALGAGWSAPDGRAPVTAREALMHAKLRIDARMGRLNRTAPRAVRAGSAEDKRELTHEAWLDLLE